jgi:hypothetical protein
MPGPEEIALATLPLNWLLLMTPRHVLAALLDLTSGLTVLKVWRETARQ